MSKCKCPKSPVSAENIFERFEESKCTCDNDARLFASEKGKKIEIVVTNYLNIDKIFVDHHFIVDEKIDKCDLFFGYMDSIEPHGSTYQKNLFVELKGENVSHACEQILSTLDFFYQNKLIKENSQINALVIPARVAPSFTTKIGQYKTMFSKKTRGGQLIIKNITARYDMVKGRCVN